MPDIELLFYLFDDPADTERVFGFKTYADFESVVPDKNKQKSFMLYTSPTAHPMALETAIIFQGESVESIIFLGIRGTMPIGTIPRPMPVHSLNWNILQHFQHLKEFTFTSTEVGGPIPLDKLPSCLKWLDLTNNKLSGTIGFSGFPPGLRTLVLMGNKMTGHVDFGRVPPRISRLDLRNNLFAINVGEIKNIDRAAERVQVLDLYVAGNQLSGVMKRSEEPFKLRHHDLRFRHYRDDTTNCQIS